VGTVDRAELMPRRLLTLTEDAEYLGLTDKALSNQVHRRQIPFVKVGRNLRFDLRQLDQFIDDHTIDEME
jgi:excisionase family DNA binding protein